MCNDCMVLHERMKGLEHELHQVKRALSNARAETKYERREKEKLIKEKKKTIHYRNGQKRSSYGRH